jgi:hypothetical protein
MFSNNELSVLNERGICKAEAEKQIERLQKGTRYIRLVAPASAYSGIVVPTSDVLAEWVRLYEQYAPQYKLLKFVPASGAASRMFKRIQELLADEDNHNLNTLLLDDDLYSIGTTLRRIDDFAFAPELAEILEIESKKPSEFVNELQFIVLLRSIIEKSGLGLSDLPKGLIAFHSYSGTSRTAFEEHICEGAAYVKSNDGKVHIHFTVSPEHRKGFEELLKAVKEKYQTIFSIELVVDFSEQMAHTDTMAIDADGNPFRNADGSLLFRPGGHGALIENLNKRTQDIVFIKNIDNVVPDRLKEDTNRYKKALGGLLLSLRNTVHEFLYECENGNPNSDSIDAMCLFANEVLNFPVIESTLPVNQKLSVLKEMLNRPIRVCGMVKNTGEPGGGPFWVCDDKNTRSLQIVEKAQIDLTKSDQKTIFEQSTHFNPVDLVCSITDYKGDAFDLTKFRDDDTYFVAEKSKDGKSLKALELPGLWNGAMAYWITVFVEVPLVTFNPVKEINDLLRSEHQPEF